MKPHGDELGYRDGLSIRRLRLVVKLVTCMAIMVLSSGCGAGSRESPSDLNKQNATSNKQNATPDPKKTSFAKQDRNGEGEDPELPENVKRKLVEVSKRQSKGLAKAKTIVHRAFHYRQDSIYKPKEGQKLVAVDVEFLGHGKGFDLDDVDIVDAASSANFGSNPEIRLLTVDGHLEQNKSAWKSRKKALRVLLIYVVPKTVKSVKIAYWGSMLTSAGVPITEDQLRSAKDRVIAGVQFWPYPRSYHFGDVWQRGRWLIVSLGSGRGTAVIDLHAWPPRFHAWNSFVRDIDIAPDGGWIVITRTGSKREDIVFPIWHHEKGRPGSVMRSNGASLSENHLSGIAVVGDQVFAYTDRRLFRFSKGKLLPVSEVGSAKGIKGQYGRSFTHGSFVNGGGREFLVWDGDGYELMGEQLKKTWKWGVKEQYEFMTVPAGDNGIFYLEQRKVFQAKPGMKPTRVMSGVENVMGIHPGPKEYILFNLGANDAGYVAGLWSPKGDLYIPLHVSVISSKLGTNDFSTFHWSEKTRRFYLVSRNGIFTIPAAKVLERMGQRLQGRTPER